MLLSYYVHYSDVMEDIQEIAVDYNRLVTALKLPITTVKLLNIIVEILFHGML